MHCLCEIVFLKIKMSNPSNDDFHFRTTENAERSLHGGCANRRIQSENEVHR